MEVQSAVRIPSPEPERPGQRHSSAPKRKEPSYERSPSPSRRPPPPRNGNSSYRDVDANRGAERERQLRERLARKPSQEPSKPLTAEEKQEKAREEYRKLQNARSGGTYIPPARLRALQAQITDKTSAEFQKMSWEALKKSINGLINKVNIGNIKFIVPELFNENLVRGRGLFCRSIMKAQAVSLPFTPIFAAMVAIVNTKLPQVGELLIKRLVSQFKKAYRRNDKMVLKSATTFIAQLCNQQVIHELMAAHMLQLLLSKPTDDSVEIAVDLMREIGQHLEEFSGPIAMLVYDQFRNILHEADIEKRTQYMIEVLFQVRKDKYKDNVAIKEELDLVEEEDQITHQPPSLDDVIDTQDGLNVFKFDSEYEENEEAYKKLKAEILGENEGSDEDEEDDSDDSSDNEEAQKEKEMEIKDQSNIDLTNLRRTIYLTINSSADFEECCHKLMKVNLPHGKEAELPSMVIETCSQRPTYEKFYGLVGERFARINRMWTELFAEQFVVKYETIHRYETNKLRNIARFFGHLLSTDAIPWHVFSVVHLNEDETTSSSRIFIKILFQELSEAMGMKKLQDRLKDETLQAAYGGLFPKDDPRNTRFSINYFTSIGMGAVTEDMREHLKNLPKPELPTLPTAGPRAANSDSDSVSSYSSYTGSSRSYSDSRSRSRSRSLSRTPPRRKIGRSVSPPARRSGITRGRSVTRSPPRQSRRRSITYTPSVSRSRSRSPPFRGAASKRNRSYTPSVSRSRTPPRRMPVRHASHSPSLSRSPPPRRTAPAARERRRNTSSPEVSRSRSPPRRATGARRRNTSSPEVSQTRSRPRRAVAGRRRNKSSPEVSRSTSPYPAKKANGGGRSEPDPSRRAALLPKRERSLSPYSRRVALTRKVGGV